MMEYRNLGASGLKVPVLSFGTATFGGSTDFFKKWGSTQAEEATHMVDLCLNAGLNLFDTANTYSRGLSEEILGRAIAGRRNQVLISTKATFPMGDGIYDYGSSRRHLLQACEDSLKRLGTDYIDIYHMHGFDALTPVDETLQTLHTLVQSGKVRYIACSNFSGWHLMKSLSVSEKNSWSRYIGHQVCYSLLNRDYEWELMPLGTDQGVGALVWSPLAGGRLSGKFGRKKTLPSESRITQGGGQGPQKPDEVFYRITDALEKTAEETGKSIAQVALRWVLQRPTVSTVIIGARDSRQLEQNLGAVGWQLSAGQIKYLDEASEQAPAYPYWHQRGFPQLMPLPDFYGEDR